MSSALQTFENKVRSEWLDDATAAAWRRWHDKSLRLWRELTDALLTAAKLEPGHRVLDLASGTGDPALTLAAVVGPTGHVVVTDLGPQMLEIARENAERAGLHNLSFDVVDAHAMPYADASFDRVTCRLGVMYFWDCARALAEIRRVLKPGGVVALIAWGPVEQNQYMRAALGPFKQRQPPPAVPPDCPHPYRFAVPGSLGAQLRAAGFASVLEETRAVRMIWPGPPDELWRRLYEVSAPMRPYFDSFTPDIRTQAIAESIVNLNAYYDGSRVTTAAPIVVASATKHHT
jgi:SAM-dependent methyltransferase